MVYSLRAACCTDCSLPILLARSLALENLAAVLGDGGSESASDAMDLVLLLHHLALLLRLEILLTQMFHLRRLINKIDGTFLVIVRVIEV